MVRAVAQGHLTPPCLPQEWPWPWPLKPSGPMRVDCGLCVMPLHLPGAFQMTVRCITTWKEGRKQSMEQIALHSSCLTWVKGRGQCLDWLLPNSAPLSTSWHAEDACKPSPSHNTLKSSENWFSIINCKVRTGLGNFTSWQRQLKQHDNAGSLLVLSQRTLMSSPPSLPPPHTHQHQAFYFVKTVQEARCREHGEICSRTHWSRWPRMGSVGGAELPLVTFKELALQNHLPSRCWRRGSVSWQQDSRLVFGVKIWIQIKMIYSWL